MADSLHKLLMYIVEHPLMRSERREAEMDATAVQDVPQEVSEIAEEHRRDAERLAPAFAVGLRTAAQHGGALTVDDNTPPGNDIADAFARFLVTTNLATSQSTELSKGHYSYRFEVDWPRLRELAQSAGVNLDDALHSAG